MAKTFKLVDILDAPWCVYRHYCEDVLFYIGSGKISRAFDCSRGQEWHAFRAGRPVTVEIAGFYMSCADARRAEYADIKAHRQLLSPSVPLATKVPQKRKDPKRVIVLDEYTGYALRRVSDVARFTGISESAIYKVLKNPGTYVHGRTFRWKYLKDSDDA